MASSTALTIGTRLYKCVGDWAMADITTPVARTALSTSNLDGVVPTNAVAVELRGTVVSRAKGSAGIVQTNIGFYEHISDADNAVDGINADVKEPSGLSVDDEIMRIPFHVTTLITNNIVDPEIIYDFTRTPGTTSFITDFAICGYWLP